MTILPTAMLAPAPMAVFDVLRRLLADSTDVVIIGISLLAFIAALVLLSRNGFTITNLVVAALIGGGIFYLANGGLTWLGSQMRDELTRADAVTSIPLGIDS